MTTPNETPIPKGPHYCPTCGKRGTVWLNYEEGKHCKFYRCPNRHEWERPKKKRQASRIERELAGLQIHFDTTAANNAVVIALLRKELVEANARIKHLETPVGQMNAGLGGGKD